MDQDLYLQDVYRVRTHQQIPPDLLVNHNAQPLLTVAMFASIFVRLPLIEEGVKKKEEKEEEEEEEDEGGKEEEV